MTDIDLVDKSDPQMCSDNVVQIFWYLRHLETVYSVRQDFMKSCSFLKPAMRTILINWLMQIHDNFNLCLETLHLTVALVDRYLNSREGSQVSLIMPTLSPIMITCVSRRKRTIFNWLERQAC